MPRIMAVAGVNIPSISASISASVRQASELAASAAARLSPVSPISSRDTEQAPARDTVEISSDARVASDEDIGRAAIETSLAKVQIQAAAALVKAEERTTGSLLDVLG